MSTVLLFPVLVEIGLTSDLNYIPVSLLKHKRLRIYFFFFSRKGLSKQILTPIGNYNLLALFAMYI